MSGASRLERLVPIAGMDREGAFGGSTGAGVTVAIVDSGVERDHPAVGGKLVRSVRVEPGEDEPVVVEDPEAIDVVGHGTACAGIIHGLAPDAEIVSVRVLGPDNRGKGTIFAAGLEWAIAQGASVDQPQPVVEERGDVRRLPRDRRPGLLRQRAARERREQRARAELPVAVRVGRLGRRPRRGGPVDLVLQPAPPVEFGAYGVDVEVAWKDGGRIIATGNSFAAPHIAGLAALIRARHPGATPFEVKTILATVANGARPGG